MAPATWRYQRGDSYKPTVEKGKKQQLIEQVFADHKRRYGSRRIVAELNEKGHQVGRHQVRTLMKLAASAFRFEPLYDSKNVLPWNAPQRRPLKMRVNQCQWGCPTVFG